MTSGVGGAMFFSPLFIIVLGLPPSVAVGTALTTELFGFSSGVYAYWKRRLIDFKLGTSLLMFAVPAAIVARPAGLEPATLGLEGPDVWIAYTKVMFGPLAAPADVQIQASRYAGPQLAHLQNGGLT